MIILGIASFVFLIYFATFLQWAFKCSANTALKVSWHTTWVSVAVLLVRLGCH